MSRGGRNTKIHLVVTERSRSIAASDRFAVTFSLSGGHRHDAPEGRKLIEGFNPVTSCNLLMDRAYEDDQTRALAVRQGFTPVVPPKKNRRKTWEYDKELYTCTLYEVRSKRRNEVERLFRRILVLRT